MQEALVWWVILEVIGAVAFPIAFVSFRFLPDRGYAFAKPLGLVVIGYTIWIASMLELLPNRQGSLITILLLLAVASAVVVRNQPTQLVAFLRGKLGYILLVEAVFAAVFAFAAFFRSYMPDIYYGEKPMNFAFLNALIRNEELPPVDPWLSGHSLSYYYLGHLMMSVVAQLGDIPSSIAFNLGSPTTFALAAAAIFGLVYNLIAAEGRTRRAVVFGFAGVAILLIVSNLEGLFELLAAHGLGSGGFYRFWDIHGLEGPRSTDAWYPTEFWWWGRAAFVNSTWGNPEFPFSSFIFGDMHSNIMSVPFTLVAAGVALNLFSADEWLDGWFWRRRPLLLLMSGLLLGALGFINLWDLPTYLGLVVLLALSRNYLLGEPPGLRLLLRTASFALPLAAVAVLLFIPFYPGFHPVGEGIHPLEAARRVSWVPLKHIVTRPTHFLIVWLPLVWLTASLAVAAVARARSRAFAGYAALWAAVPAALVLGMWALMILARRGPIGFGEEIGERGYAWLTAFILTGVLATAVLGFMRQGKLVGNGQASPGLLFALATAGTGILLILGMELFWVQDPKEVRAMTMLKLGYQAWTLLSVGGAFALYYVTSGWRLTKALVPPLRLIWGATTFVIMGAALVFPVTATFYITDSFDLGDPPGLDGLRFSRLTERSEYEATRWLREEVEGTPVVLEALDGSYSGFGRVSSRTGLPTLVAWPEHEYRWRGSWEPQAGRREAIEKIYTAPDSPEAKALLDEYEVEYVYVGRLEKETYGEEGLRKFATFMEVVFRNEGVTIYQARE